MVGAFSHLPPPSINGPPFAEVVIRMERARNRAQDPLTYLDEWLTSDEQSTHMIRRSSASSRRETIGGCERAISELGGPFCRGDEVPETRMVDIDPSTDKVAYLKCCFRSIQMDNAQNIKEMEKRVLNSFSFIGN